jgi:hypothetical protein
VYSEFMPNGTTINSEWYCETLGKLKAWFLKSSSSRGVASLSTWQCMTTHKCKNNHTHSMLQVHCLASTTILATTLCHQIFIFPKLKKHLRQHNYASNGEIKKTAVKLWLSLRGKILQWQTYETTSKLVKVWRLQWWFSGEITGQRWTIKFRKGTCYTLHILSHRPGNFNLSTHRHENF